MTDTTTDLASIAAASLANSRRWFPAVYSRGQVAALVHCGLGLTGEVGEVAELFETSLGTRLGESAALGEELSDVYAYVLNLAGLLNVDLGLAELAGSSQANFTDLWMLVGLVAKAGAVANLVKKLDTGKESLAEVHPELTSALSDAYLHLLRLAALYGIDLAEEWTRKQAICEERWGNQPPPPIILTPERPDARPPLTYLGQDGQWLAAIGHIDERLMICFAVAGWADDCGVTGTLDSLLPAGQDLDALAGLVHHRWVVQIDHPRPGCERGEPSLWWRHPETDEPITADTPGAFAITTFDTEG